jgi:hypothetical protein
MSKIIERSGIVDRPLDRVFTDPRGWRHGSVITSLGAVVVYADNRETTAKPCTSFDFVWQGRLYHRSIEGRVFTKRGIVTMAGRFAREVTYG